MKKDDFRYDKRIVTRNLQSGKVTKSEFDRYLKSLKDLSLDAASFEASLAPLERKVPTRVLNEDDEL